MDATYEGDTFEELKDYLSSTPAVFFVIYRNKSAGDKGGELVWHKAVSRGANTRAEHVKLADTYLKVAQYSYQTKKVLILSPNVAGPNSADAEWCGLPVSKSLSPPPANELGQRVWHLAVGAGPTRQAGYAIVLRLLAKDTGELEDCIAKIQNIMCKEVGKRVARC